MIRKHASIRYATADGSFEVELEDVPAIFEVSHATGRLVYWHKAESSHKMRSPAEALSERPRCRVSKSASVRCLELSSREARDADRMRC